VKADTFVRNAIALGMLATAIGGAGCAPHASETTTRLPEIVPPAEFVPQRPTVAFPGVPNFGVVSADLWRGGRPTPDGLRALADAGVRTIIDLQLHGESTPVPPGVKYVRLPVPGWHAHQVDVEAVLRAIDQSPKPVFVHCAEGRDRTGLAVAAYRVDQGMSLHDAFAELTAFHVHPWWRTPIERRVATFAERARG
jgi:protein tyrosine phosphatase (PTP) superfamily phosphohydrolase (DUF442 family)